MTPSSMQQLYIIVCTYLIIFLIPVSDFPRSSDASLLQLHHKMACLQESVTQCIVGKSMTYSDQRWQQCSSWVCGSARLFRSGSSAVENGTQIACTMKIYDGFRAIFVHMNN